MSVVVRRARVSTAGTSGLGSVLIVPVLLAGASILVLARSFRAFFWQDDFVFLTQAREAALSWSYLTTPLFTHFSPIARAWHWMISHSSTGWTGVRVSMFLVLFAGGLLLTVFAIRLGATMWLAVAAGALWLLNPAQLRTAAWWSAFVQDVPQVPLLFAALILWVRFARRGGKVTAAVLLLTLVLNGLAHELGYLSPIFLAAAVLLTSEGGRHLRSSAYRMFAVSVVISAGFIWVNSTYYAPDLPNPTPLALLRSTAAFVGGASVPALLGQAPWTTWPSVMAGVLGFVAMAVLVVWRLKENHIKFLVGLFMPMGAVAFTLAFGRAGLENGDGVPRYPLDLQYQPLALAWAVSWFAVCLSRPTREAKHRPKGAFSSGILAASLWTSLVAISVGVQDLAQNERVILQFGQLGVSRVYKESLAALGPGEFAVQQSVPFVLPQFGEYAFLSTAAAVFDPGRPAPILAGDKAVALDAEIGQRPLAKADTVPLKPAPCQIVSPDGEPVSVQVTAKTGETLLGHLAADRRVTVALSGTTQDSKGAFATWSFGPPFVIDGQTTFAFTVPLQPNQERGVTATELTIFYVQSVEGVGSKVCVGDLRVASASH